MAKKKRHSPTEIVTKLGQADILSNEGQTQSEIAKSLRHQRHDISSLAQSEAIAAAFAAGRRAHTRSASL